MPPPIAAAIACLIFALPADPQSTTAILSRQERLVANEQTSAKIAFIQHVAAAEARFDQMLPMVSPPEWGKTISPAAGGTIAFRSSFEHGFFGRLALEGLEPNRPYLLAFNGKPGLKGNELLPDPVPGLPDERYYDLLDFAATPQGSFEATLAVKLAPGDYHLRLYVKDASDWKIVLYHDYFEFKVE